MKTSRKIIILVIVIGAFAASCKKEVEETPESPPPIVNQYYIEFDGNKIGIDTCYDIYHIDQWNNYYHEYTFVPRTISFNNFLSSLSGKSDGFIMWFERPNDNFIAPGEYILDSTTTAPANGEIWQAYFCVNYDFGLEDGQRINMKSGKCEITATGALNEYEIEGTFLGEDKKSIKSTKRVLLLAIVLLIDL